MTHQEIPIDRLRAREDNPNRMPDDLFAKLCDHIRRTGHYPAIIVRPSPGDVGSFEILDGHHRIRALQAVGHTTAQCDVWEVDDNEALMLLATLNRLAGQDDPLKRADILHRLRERFGRERVVDLIPETRERFDRLLELRQPPPPPMPPSTGHQIPEAITFFLTSEQRTALDARLRQATSGGTRSARLVALLNLDSDRAECTDVVTAAPEEMNNVNCPQDRQCPRSQN